MTLQGEAQDWFHALPLRSVWNFNELSLVFAKECSCYSLIKKMLDHLFNIVTDPKESIHNYVKRLKVEKAKIVGCSEGITTTSFKNEIPIEHPLFGKLIMGGELTLATSYALVEKHALWDEAKKSCGNKQKNNRMNRSPNRDNSAPETFTKFIVLIGHILRKLKNEPWFKLPSPMKGDLSQLDQTKYCAFH